MQTVHFPSIFETPCATFTGWLLMGSKFLKICFEWKNFCVAPESMYELFDFVELIYAMVDWKSRLIRLACGEKKLDWFPLDDGGGSSSLLWYDWAMFAPKCWLFGEELLIPDDSAPQWKLLELLLLFCYWFRLALWFINWLRCCTDPSICCRSRQNFMKCPGLWQ